MGDWQRALDNKRVLVRGGLISEGALLLGTQFGGLVSDGEEHLVLDSFTEVVTIEDTSTTGDTTQKIPAGALLLGGTGILTAVSSSCAVATMDVGRLTDDTDELADDVVATAVGDDFDSITDGNAGVTSWPIRVTTTREIRVTTDTAPTAGESISVKVTVWYLTIRKPSA